MAQTVRVDLFKGNVPRCTKPAGSPRNSRRGPRAKNYLSVVRHMVVGLAHNFLREPVARIAE